jgi:Xaa-Pro aminopeptidase
MGMDKKFFQANRQRLIETLKGGIIVLSGYSAMQRGNDASFAFEQEANFWWLTGIDQPDWWIIIDGIRNKSWLVAPTISSSHQIFDGSLSVQEASKISGIDTILSNDDAMTLLRDLAKKHSIAYAVGDHPYAEHFDFVVNPAQKKLHQILERIFNDVTDVQLDIAKLRAIKQPEEISAIKRAIKLTIKSFEDVKVLLPELKTEYEIEAEFTYAFRRAGSNGHAYDPIVADGKNACTLHYGQNKDRLKKNTLVLMDIGARVDGYAADITRTYAYGEPTARQKEVHTAVEDAHKQIIKLLSPGLSVSEYNDKVDSIMKLALDRLGLLKTDNDYRIYFPHAISHGLGVDVHDSLGRPTHFLENMVLTVEPGIYIPEEGIGVRIEDDILITSTGRQNLSAALPTRL